MANKTLLFLALLILAVVVIVSFLWLNGEGPDSAWTPESDFESRESIGTAMDTPAEEPTMQVTVADPSKHVERVEPAESLPGPEEKYVTVLVLEEGTELPIQGVRATLYKQKKGRVDIVSEELTGADGRCKLSISGLEDAEYLHVPVFKPGYTTDTGYVFWDEDGWSEDVIELRLNAGIPLSIEVLEASSRRPVNGAMIHLFQDRVESYTLVEWLTLGEWNFKTDEKGCCLIPAIRENRPFDLKVYHPDFAQVCRFNQFCKPDMETLILLGSGACIEGSVHIDGGIPLQGAVVKISEPECYEFSGLTRTGEDGGFRVIGLDYGKRYEVETEVEDLGYLDTSVVTDKLRENRDPCRVDLIVKSIGTVLFVDVFDQDGQPMEELLVQVMKWDERYKEFKTHKEGKTDAEGRFRCFPLITGHALVKIGPDMWNCLARHKVNIIEDDETRIRSVIPSGKAIQGVVRHHDGRPAGDVRVCVYSKDPLVGAPDDWLARLRNELVRLVAPDEKGRFLVKALPFELVDLYITQDFYDPEDGVCSSELVLENVRIGTDDLDVTLPPPGTIKGKVHCDDRPDQIKILVWRAGLIPSFGRFRTSGFTLDIPLDSSGGFSFDLPYTNRELKLDISVPGYSIPHVQNIRLHPGRVQDLGDMVFTRGIAVKGRVTDKGGKPVPATIEAGELSIHTDEEGLFYADNVHPDIDLYICEEGFIGLWKNLKEFPNPMDIEIILQRPGSLFIKVSDKGRERRDLDVGWARLNAVGEVAADPWFVSFDEKFDAYAFLDIEPGTCRIFIEGDESLLDETRDLSLNEGEQKTIEIKID